MRKIFLLALILLQFSSIAQNSSKPVLDSLLGLIGKAQDDTTKVNLLNKASEYYRKNNSDEGIRYAQQALQLARKLDWDQGTWSAYNNLGYHYLIKSDKANAIINLNEALKITEKIGNKPGMITVYLNIGEAYYIQSDFPKAQEYFFKALKLSESMDRKNDIALCLTSIGLILRSQENYPQALEYLNRALAIQEKLSNKDGLVKSYGLVGTIYFLQEKWDLAREYHFKALKLAGVLGDNKQIAENYVSLGNIYSEEHENETALEYQFKALKIYEAAGNKNGIANILGNLGITYLNIASDTERDIKAGTLIPAGKNANLEKAKVYLEQAVKIELELGELNVLQQWYSALSEVNQLLGNSAAALEYYKESARLKDSVFSQSNFIKFNNIEKEFEAQKRKEADRNNRNIRIFLVIGMVLLLLIVILIGRGYNTQRKLNGTITRLVNEQEQTIRDRTRELALSNDQLAESNEKLEILNKQLIDLIQYNAHNVREPLTRILGAMSIKEYMTEEEFARDMWPEMQRAANDLDNNIKSVIKQADETAKLKG